MFPAVADDETQLLRKEFVFSVTQVTASKAWSLNSFEQKPVISVQLGAIPIVLFGDATTRSVRAYERGAAEIFEWSSDEELLLQGEKWAVE